MPASSHVVDSLPGDDVPVGDLIPLLGRLIQSSSGNYKEAQFATAYGTVRLQVSGDREAMVEFEQTVKVAVGAALTEDLGIAVNLFDIGRRARQAHGAVSGSSSTDASDFGALLEDAGLVAMQEIVRALERKEMKFTDLAGIDLVGSVGLSLGDDGRPAGRGAVGPEGGPVLTIRVTFDVDTSATAERPVKWRALIDPKALPPYRYEADAVFVFVTKGLITVDGDDYHTYQSVTKLGSADVSAYTRGNRYVANPYGLGNL